MAIANTVAHIDCPICQSKVAVLIAKDDQSVFKCGQCETLTLVPKVAWNRAAMATAPAANNPPK
jgi:hypothetical protein